MEYGYKDLDNIGNDKAPVIVLCCSSLFISRIAEDKCATACLADKSININKYKDFIAKDDTSKDSGRLLLSDYVTYAQGRRVCGRWFCHLEYSGMSSKEFEQMYWCAKNTSSNGMLLITVRDRRAIDKVLANKYIMKNGGIHVYNLGYPPNSYLRKIIKSEAAKHKVKITPQAIDLFIRRMGSKFEDYHEYLDRIFSENEDATVDFNLISSYLAGVENYAKDDFIEALLTPPTKDKIVTNRKLYKILNSILNEYSPGYFVKVVQERILDMMEYRKYINDGTIPIWRDYEPGLSQLRIPEESRIKKTKEFSFRKSAELSNKTSLEDWTKMYLMLKQADTHDDTESLRALLAICHRAIYSKDRMYNYLGLRNVLNTRMTALGMLKPTSEAE